MDQNELCKRVNTIVIVMMENRSFDHILGHMSQADYGGRADIDGITSLVDARFANPSSNGSEVFPFIMRDGPLPNDLPHERDMVAVQLAPSAVTGGATLTGFVKAYEMATGTTGVLQPPPMGLLTPRDLPATGFFSCEYAVCDRWFAPLPTSTQPNRLMAMSGYTMNDTTHRGLLPDQDTVLDWLTANNVRWRVYSAGISFFTLMPKLWPLLLTDHFRSLSALSFDAQHEPEDERPQVIFVEPDYDDSPVHLSGHASDNHPPLPMAFGEAFLRQVYEALTSSAERWKRTVMFVLYDEHGGFFDHVRPLPVPCAAPAGANYVPFRSTGLRVPTVVVSPMVARGSAKHTNFDHTSILQLLAERFGAAGEVYSANVEARRVSGIVSASMALDTGVARNDVPAISITPIPATAALISWREPSSANHAAFVAAVEGFADAHGLAAQQKFPEIAHWMAPT